MPSVKLSKSQFKQIERLAKLANSTAEKMLATVFEYGVEVTEDLVRGINAAEDDIKNGRLIPHDEILAEMEKHRLEYEKRYSGKIGYRIVKEPLINPPISR